MAIIDVEDNVITPTEAGLAIQVIGVSNGLVAEYTLTMSNLGPDKSESVVLLKTLPQGIDIIRFSPSTGDCESHSSRAALPIDCSGYTLVGPNLDSDGYSAIGVGSGRFLQKGSGGPTT